MPKGYCKKFTAPINIKKTQEICDLTCEYDFDYNDSSVVVNNNDNNLTIKYDRPSKPQATFKGGKYYVKEIQIYFPSLHTFNDNAADGEMVIIHTGEQGENDLVICIPIKKMDATSKSAIDLEIIVNQTNSHAPASGDSVHINTLNMNLNNFIPKKPYYYYSGTFQFNDCTKKNDIIVFDYLNNAYTTMTNITYNNLKNTISAHDIAINSKNKDFFYNINGPKLIRDDNIYIDCQPAGNEGQVLMSTNKAPDELQVLGKELMKLQNSSVYSALIGVLLMVGTYIIGSVFFKRISDRGGPKKALGAMTPAAPSP